MGLISTAYHYQFPKRYQRIQTVDPLTFTINESLITTSDMSKSTSTDAVGLSQTMDTIDAIADLVFDNESYAIRLDRAVVAAKQAKADADAAAKHLADIRAEILSLMQQSDLAVFECPDGTVTVCKGRRTVSVTDPALKAEITLIKERGVRTGRCTVKTGDPYVTIK